MATKKEEVLNRQSFISKFNHIAPHKHRYEVFKDFIVYVALELHNGFIKINKAEEFFKNFNALEQEFLATVNKYNQKERMAFVDLLLNLMVIYDSEPEPRDVIGSLFMELGLANELNGQYFTPSEVAELMAMITYGADLQKIDKPFLKVSEPACGAGGMILAFAKIMVKNKINPTEKMWVQAVDVDRIMSLICYIQLFVYNIPAEVIVGNSLTLEYREYFYTPAYYIGGWSEKLRLYRVLDLIRELESKPIEPIAEGQTFKVKAKPPTEHKKVFTESNGKPQLDFFDLFIEH